MIQVIGIPMGSNPAPFFANLFLAHKEAVWVKAQLKLGTINLRKINNSLRFIDDLLSLKDGSTFKKHCKYIYPTELELKNEKIRMPFYCSNVPSKMFYGSIGAEFLRISRATSKINDLSRNCKQF